MRFVLCLTLSLCPILAGCLHVSVRGDRDPAGVRAGGIANGFASYVPVPERNGPFLDAGVDLFGDGRHSGEVVHLDLWPIFGIGVGVAGARLRILPIEVGVGTLFYHPRPSRRWRPEPEEWEEPVEVEEDEDAHGPDRDGWHDGDPEGG
ncbi:MAG: hypothetical protein ACE5GW_11205 [Planctomycetota bacterium]